MNSTRVRTVAVLICLGFLSGCGTTAPQPKVAGIVTSHVDSYRSGTGGSSDLIRDKQMVGGFHYGDAKKTDWKSEIHWDWIGHRGESDVYQFKWVFSRIGVVPVSSSREVEYNGKTPVIVFQNDSETVSIEPGSMPLPQNSQESL